MNQELHSEDIGEQLGVESVETAVGKVEKYCQYEEQRIALTNQPKILALKYEGSLLQDEERDLIERLRQAPPPGDLRSRKLRASYYWGVTAVLTLAGFAFSLVAFDPYRFGWKTYLYCLAIAVLTPFLAEMMLDKWKTEKLIKSDVAVACLAALVSLMLLALIRGNVLAEQMNNSTPVIAFDNAQQQPTPQDNFYAATIPFLRLVMILLALSMELGAGLALHEAWRSISDVSEDWEQLRRRLAEIRQRITGIIHELTKLESEPAVFVSRFWRNFYRGLVTHSVRSSMTKLLLLTLAVLMFVGSRASAQETTWVVEVDLTQSVALQGPDQKTEFQKNIDGVTRLLAEAPANSRVIVLGITDKSFAQPYIILSATIPGDAGYFGERLGAARSELVRAWRARSVGLRPKFRYTDILGALEIASQMFHEKAGTDPKELFIFSDMRQRTPNLDLETHVIVASFSTMKKRTNVVVADLHGVQVYAMGVDGSDRSIAYWQSLHKFWSEYFGDAGASVKKYSPFRDPLWMR
jgi:cell division protein FtsB